MSGLKNGQLKDYFVRYETKMRYKPSNEKICFKPIDTNELRSEKYGFLHICQNKDADQLAVTAKLISAFVFDTRIVQSLYFLKTKFQCSNHLL